MFIIGITLISIIVLFLVIYYLYYYENSFNGLSKFIITASIVMILMAIIAPYVFTRPVFASELNFTGKGAIGDTIGGLMNPFIGLAGVLLTFLAFYIQYLANEKIENQFRLQQFESQFYEMLRLHKENVNELEIETFDEIIKGRSVFKYLNNELTIYLDFLVQKRKEEEKPLTDKDLNNIYGLLFWGEKNFPEEFNNFEFNNHIFSDRKFKDILLMISRKSERINNNERENFQHNFNLTNKITHPLLRGNHTVLGHYYRHLFQTVKLVANQKHISYTQKREYLRILRSQLSDYEQILLYYNWKCGFGKQWENDINKFFTDYRMIHNLNPDLLFKDDIFDIKMDFRKNPRNELDVNGKERINDTLFESDEWG